MGEVSQTPLVGEIISSRRRCGTCTLCCKLVPVRELKKRAGERCKFQRHTGCQVYHRIDKGFPLSCGLWNCAWLANADAEELRRPDRAGYVIDMTADFVTITNNETGEREQVEVAQIWCDTSRPDAWKDPALLVWLERRAAKGVLGLVRFNNEGAIGLFPPRSRWNPTDHWVAEGGTKEALNREHSPAEKDAALHEIRAERPRSTAPWEVTV
jgi:hypothetical protein